MGREGRMYVCVCVAGGERGITATALHTAIHTAVHTAIQKDDRGGLKRMARKMAEMPLIERSKCTANTPDKCSAYIGLSKPTGCPPRPFVLFLIK